MKVKYCDHRPIYFPKLVNYPGGLTLPGKKTNEIDVTDKEWRTLKKMRNGAKVCFEPVTKKPEKSIIIEEAGNGDR